ncbi:MAG TPA: VC0807 family protein [Caulobacteraceae bacterium]|jgi:hypothetical protein
MADLRARLAQAWAYARRNAAGTGLELLVNFALPYAIYDLTKGRLGDVHALMASSAPPILWSIAEFIRRRRVDALSILVLAGIALSLLGYIGGGGVKALQLRERLVTISIGLAFLVSAAIGRPLIYYLAIAGMRRRNAPDIEAFESRRHLPMFKRTMLVMTLVWGFGLVGEALVSLAAVFAVSIKTYFIVGPIIGYTTVGGLTAWTYWFATRQRRKGEAATAAAAAAAAAATAHQGRAAPE